MFEKRIFIIFFVIIFSVVTGVGVVVPILPVYASSVGRNGIEIGLILGSFSLSRGLFLVYFGKKFDVVKKKSHIVFSLLLYTMIPIGFIYYKDVNIIIFLRFIQGIASSIIVSFVYAYVGKFTPQGNEGKTTGIFNISIFMGMLIGPFLGGFFVDKFGNSSAFLFMSFLSFFGFIVSLLFIPSKILKKKSYIVHKFYWLIIFGDLSILGLLCIRLTYTFCVGIIWNFVPILSFSKYSLPFFSIGLLITFGVCVSGMLNIPVGLISDIVDRKLMIIFGVCFVLLSIFSFFFANCFWNFFYSNIFFGFGGGLLTPTVVASAVVMGNKNNSSGYVMSLFTTGHSIGMIFGSFLSGYMIYFGVSKYIFLFGVIILLLGLFVFIFFTKKKDLVHNIF